MAGNSEQLPDQELATLPEPAALKVPPPASDPFLGVSERERRFAVAFVEVAVEIGSDHEAMETAYFRAFPQADVDGSRARQLARQMLRKDQVQRVVAFLRQELSVRAMVPVSRLVNELERVAFARLVDFGRVLGDGSFQIDLRRMGMAVAPALKTVKVKERVLKTLRHEEGEGDDAIQVAETILTRSTEIELHSKTDALDKLAKIHGLYADINLNLLTPEMLDLAIRRMEQKMRGQPIMEVTDATAS